MITLVDHFQIWVSPAQFVGIAGHTHAAWRCTVAGERIPRRVTTHVIAVRHPTHGPVVRRAPECAGDSLTGDSPESRPTRLASDLPCA